MSEARFLPVSPELLHTNLRDLEPSPRGYSPDELRMIVRSIDQVYARMDAGATHEDLLALRQSPDARDRSVGEAYACVFRGRDSSHPLRADVVDGELVVDAGNHRVRAAQDLGVRALPVEVRGRDAAEIERTETRNACILEPEYTRLRENTDRGAGQRPRDRPRDRRIGREDR